MNGYYFIDNLHDRCILTKKAEGKQDLVETFDFLLRGSYNHHWAFNKGMKNLGSG